MSEINMSEGCIDLDKEKFKHMVASKLDDMVSSNYMRTLTAQAVLEAIDECLIECEVVKT